MRGGDLAVGVWCDWVPQLSAQAAVDVNDVAIVTAERGMREGLPRQLPAGETAGNGTLASATVPITRTPTTTL